MICYCVTVSRDHVLITDQSQKMKKKKKRKKKKNASMMSRAEPTWINRYCVCTNCVCQSILDLYRAVNHKRPPKKTNLPARTAAIPRQTKTALIFRTGM